MKDLTLTDEVLLLAIWKLNENAYGVTIRRYLSKKTNRVYPYGTLYSALDKLVRRGFLTKTVSNPTPERGGRSKNYFQITQEGILALKNAMELNKMLWDPETQLSLEKS